MKISQTELIGLLPYGKNFRFVDTIDFVDNYVIEGSYTFRNDLFFADSHFSHKPLVPGVILTECMGQIGMVAHLIYLTGIGGKHILPVLSNMEVTFFKEVGYGSTCMVHGEKIVFRNNTLKSKVLMKDSHGEPIAGLTANIMMQCINKTL